MGVPDWDKEEAFGEFVSEFWDVNELLLAVVNVKEDRKLAKKFQVEEEQFWPEIIFFKNENFDQKKSKSNLVESRYGRGASVDEIRSFVRGILNFA